MANVLKRRGFQVKHDHQRRIFRKLCNSPIALRITTGQLHSMAKQITMNQRSAARKRAA